MADDKPTTIERLPLQAQDFLKRHFALVGVSAVTQDDDLLHKEYEVVLDDGTHIDFNSRGEWQQIEVCRGEVPRPLLPARVASFVAREYAEQRIIRIERERRTLEVELSNGIELSFNRRGELVGIES